MRIVCFVLALLVVPAALAMDAQKSKEQKSKQQPFTQETARISYPGDTLDGHALTNWGFIDSVSPLVCTLSFPQNDYWIILLSHWNFPKDALEKENEVIDLSTWFCADYQKIEAIMKKEPDNYKSPLKEAFDTYRTTLFTLGSEDRSCVLSNELVSFFPFLNAAKNFNKEPLLKDTTKRTLILFKKSLTIMYNYCKRHSIASFDILNAVTDGHDKKLIDAFSALEKIEDVADLWEIGHLWDIKPLCKALLKSLSVGHLKEFIALLPNEYLPYLVCLVGKSNFVAGVVAHKLSSMRAQTSLQVDDPLVVECLERFADVIFLLKIVDLTPTEPSSEGDKIDRYCYKKGGQHRRISFYELLDTPLQEALKNILIKKYTIPTTAHWLVLKNSEIDGDIDNKEVYKADRYLCDYSDEIYFFTRNGKLACFYEAHRWQDELRHDFEAKKRIQWKKDDVSLEPVACIGRFSQGKKVGTSWFMTGDKNGVVYIKNLAREEGDRVVLTFHPQPHWGAVTALCDTSSSIIAAYESGAVQAFDIGDFKIESDMQPIVLSSNSAPALSKNYRIQLEEGSLSPTSSKSEDTAKKRELEVPEHKEYCHLLVADDTSVIGAYKNGLMRLWKNKKFERFLRIPAPYEIVSMCLLNKNRVAVGCHEGTVYTIDLSDGKILRTFDIKNSLYKQAVTALAFFGKNLLAVGYENKRACIWDLDTGKLVKTIEKLTYATVVGLSAPVDQRSGHGESMPLIDVIYSDGTGDRFFITEHASLPEIISVLKEQSLL